MPRVLEKYNMKDLGSARAIKILMQENASLKNALPTAHISTTSTQLTNSAEGLPIENVALCGAVSQETTTGKQLFDNSMTETISVNTTKSTINTGVRVTTRTTSNTQFCLFVIKDLTNYVGKTIRMKANYIASALNVGNYKIGLCNSDGTDRTGLSATTATSGTTISFVVPTIEDEKKYLCAWLYSNSNGTAVVGDYVDYTNIVVTIDNEDMTYEEYTGRTSKS